MIDALKISDGIRGPVIIKKGTNEKISTRAENKSHI